MITKLNNSDSVKNSHTLAGLRELVREYRNKTNEIIDYLLDKEATKTYKYSSSVCCDSSFRVEGDTKEGTMYDVCDNCGKACDIKLEEKETSKVEYPFQHDFEPDKNGKCWCNIPKESGYHTHPPQQEESRGECKHNWHPNGESCVKCGATYKESMKGKVYLVDERNFEFKPQLKEESPKEDEWEFKLKQILMYEFPYQMEEVLLSFIKANFVSKVKIKREANRIAGQYPTNEDFRYGIKRGIKELLKSLGLEEL